MAGAQDDRFAKLSSDPRYRLPSKKNAKIGVDKRFNRMFKDDDQDFNRRSKVDKHGRKVSKGSNAQHKSLQNLYREEEEEEEASEEEPTERKKGGKSRKLEIASASEDESEDTEDDDAQVSAELRRIDANYDPARDGGFSSSDEDSSDEEEAEDAELPEESEASKVPLGEVSSRLAIVNLDWDNIRAADIFAVAQSFIPGDGHIKSCAIYPSEFGKERLEREELEGPPKEIFAGTSSKPALKGQQSDEDEDEDEDDEDIQKRLQQGDKGEEFDATALRRYQLDRLRYFYAVLTCSSPSVAQAVYSELDGKEYMTTANFFDLRFIPDEVSFEDDRPRESLEKLPKDYKPNEFVTEALTHSKVKLTWDADDASRKEVQKRAFSRKEVDENDLQAYIGGSSDSEDEESADEIAEDESGSKLSKKELEKQRKRALLGFGAEKKEKRSNDKPVGDMQITFSSGLSGGREGRGVFENSPERDETTRERYVRKERERKARRKENAKARREGATTEEAPAEEETPTAAPADPSADPFDDPFFNDPTSSSKPAKSKPLKADRLAKRAAKQAEEARQATERANLEKLMHEGETETMNHFDMKAEAKAAKDRKKKKKSKRGDDTETQQQPEHIETADPRFAALYDSHEYAIDPTNPRFSGTEGMKLLLEEGRKRRRDDAVEETAPAPVKKQARQGEDTAKLLARVKARSKQ